MFGIGKIGQLGLTLNKGGGGLVPPLGYAFLTVLGKIVMVKGTPVVVKTS